jgi:hypothetical protein
MATEVICNHCLSRARVEEVYLGRAVRCPGCRQLFTARTDLLDRLLAPGVPPTATPDDVSPDAASNGQQHCLAQARTALPCSSSWPCRTGPPRGLMS